MIFWFLSLLLFFLPNVIAECPAGSVLYSSMSMCYFFMTTPLDFSGAESSCNDLGGNLVSIHDSFANSFIQNEAQSSFGNNFWIGISCTSNNCNWTDGSPFSFTDFTSPANLSGCGSMSLSNGYWNTESCSNKKAFVCQRAETLLTPTPSQALCPSDDWYYFNETNSCYYWTYFSNWSIAEAFCVSQNAHLTSIHSDAELGFLKIFYNGVVWVGLHADKGPIQFNTTWYWTDGSYLDYLQWGGAYCFPNLGNNSQCVVGSPSGYIWNIDCSSNYTGICKRPSTKIIVPTATSSPPISECAEGWIYYKETNSCYLESTPNLTQNAAENFCNSMGGHIASIHNYNELSFLIYVASNQNIWAGLYATDIPIQINSTWKWTDNTPVDYVPWNNSFPTLNNNPCVSSTMVKYKYNTTYTFQNVDCSSSYITICKQSPLNTVTPSSPPSTVKPATICDNAWTFSISFNYFVPYAQMNWTTAEGYCEFCGGYLTSFHSRDEVTKMATNLWKIGLLEVDERYLWAGLYSTNDGRTWKWKDGTTYDFSLWLSQNPIQGGSNCANFDLPPTGINGMTNQLNCSAVLYVICIKP